MCDECNYIWFPPARGPQGPDGKPGKDGPDGAPGTGGIVLAFGGNFNRDPQEFPSSDPDVITWIIEGNNTNYIDNNSGYITFKDKGLYLIDSMININLIGDVNTYNRNVSIQAYRGFPPDTSAPITEIIQGAAGAYDQGVSIMADIKTSFTADVGDNVWFGLIRSDPTLSLSIDPVFISKITILKIKSL